MSSDSTQTAVSYLEQILQDVHPLMAEALYLAAIPQWYDADLFATMRQRDDDRNEGIIERLNRYSFIIPLQTEADGQPTYAVRPDERRILQRHWITKDRTAYLSAHARALTYWQANPDPNPYAHQRNLLYHTLFADQDAATRLLIHQFRTYHKTRQLTAVDRLLDTVKEARFFLLLLNRDMTILDDLVQHIRARLRQLHGNWAGSLEDLKTLRYKADLAPAILPFVTRAYGEALTQTGQFEAAIEQHKLALQLFDAEAARFVAEGETPATAVGILDSDQIEIERAYTMIAFGDAHVALAEFTRGQRETIFEPSNRLPQQLRDIVVFFFSLPLVFFLSLFLGRHVWHPRFWPALRDLDWIIARPFAIAASQYNRADPILEKYGEPEEGVAADEKLAYLYLALNDNEQAKSLFVRLLAEEEAPLSHYRRASVHVGLGRALLQLGQADDAQRHFNQALPMLADYEDRQLEASTHTLLAEAYLTLGETAASINHFGKAIDLFQQQKDAISATEIADRLESFAEDETIAPDQQESARHVANRVKEWHYPIQYRHPATVLMLRAIFFLLAVVIFLIPIYTINLSTSSILSPSITFRGREVVMRPEFIFGKTEPANDEADPIADEAPTSSNTASPSQFRPRISDAGLAVNAVPSADTDVVFQIAVYLIIGYVVFSTAVGLAAISWTPLRSIQRTDRSQLVRLDEEGIAVDTQTVRWQNIARLFKADFRLVEEPIPDESAFILATPQQQLVINGNTVRYKTVKARATSFLPPSVTTIDLGYRLLYSWIGVWYVLSGVLLAGLGFLGQLAPILLNYDLPGTAYSLADLYPYFYLGVFVPPMWIFMLKWMGNRRRLKPTSRVVWWVGGAGVLLFLLRLGTLFYPWFTMPDIYPSLAILLFISSAAVFLWRARHHDTAVPVYPHWLRGAAVFFAVLVLVIMGSHIRREVAGYHHLIVGNSFRDQSLVAEEEEEAQALAEQALKEYTEAFDISQAPLLTFIDTRVAIRFLAPILRPTQSIWFAALNNRAAIYSQLGNFEAAITDYEDLLRYDANIPEIVISRAIAELGASTQPGDDADTDEPDFQPILKRLGDVIANNPQNAYFYLWRGVTYHISGDAEAAFENYEMALIITGRDALDSSSRAQALTGQGWIRYSQREYDEAVGLFDDALKANENSVEAYLGLGFSYFSLGDYNKALDAWEKTAALDPADPLIYVSLGTVHWRLGTISESTGAAATDRCIDPDLTDQEKMATAASLEQAIAYFTQSVNIPGQNPIDVAATYRNRARIQYLLRNCPGYNEIQVLQEAIDSYSEAIRLNPNRASYWHLRGRLRYAVWANLPAGIGPSARVRLFDALDDTEEALKLNPIDLDVIDYQPNDWYGIIYGEAVNGTLIRGDERMAAQEYDIAQGYFELVANREPTVARAAFKAGLVAIALGDEDRAWEWYMEGATRVKTTQDVAEIALARTELEQFLRQNPGLVTETAQEITIFLRQNTPALNEVAEVAGLDAQTAFTLGLVALGDGNIAGMADWYNRGLELATESQDIGLVRTAARELGNFLANNPDIDDLSIYWPLYENVKERETAVPALSQPDLFWRYRAEFGFRLVAVLFKERPGNESNYARIYTAIIDDIERAAALNLEAHQVWRDFYVDANIGWHYLRRGDDAFTEEAYEMALDDYETATKLIQPNSANALNDLTEVTFKAGLTALLLGDPKQATTWYDAGIDLVQQYEGNEAKLEEAQTQLTTILDENPNLARTARPILNALAAAAE